MSDMIDKDDITSVNAKTWEDPYKDKKDYRKRSSCAYIVRTLKSLVIVCIATTYQYHISI